MSNGRRIRELSLAPAVTRLSCGAEKRELDIRSDVESVTRFSVIESKISLKNERRSRCISPRGLRLGERGERRGAGGGGLVGNARETRFHSPRARVKIDLPPPLPAPPRCWNSISLVYVALRIPLCAQNELNIFAARTSASERAYEQTTRRIPM